MLLLNCTKNGKPKPNRVHTKIKVAPKPEEEFE